MVFIHRTWTLSSKCTEVVHVKNIFQNARIRFFATEVQVHRELPRRYSFEKQKKIQDNKIDGVACFMLMMPVTAFGLGVWQIMRKIEKTKMIRHLQEKTSKPPVDLPKDLNQLQDMEFQPVRVKGKFDHSKELYVGPRPLSNEHSLESLNLFSHPKGGYMVITPFTLSDRNLTILVNRGWVPGNKKSPESRKEGQVTEEVELVGLVRHDEKRPQFSMKNKPEKGFWLYKDLDEMSEVTKASPILIEAVPSSSIPGGPIGGQTNVRLKDEHLSYMLSWFGISLVTGWMWYNRYIKKAKVARGLVF